MKLPTLDMDQLSAEAGHLLNGLLEIRDRATFADRAVLAELDKAINLQRRATAIIGRLAEDSR